MNDGNSGSGEREDVAAELAAIAAETGWRCWAGVIPVLYASRPLSSPPVLVRAADPAGLRAAIAAAEAGAR